MLTPEAEVATTTAEAAPKSRKRKRGGSRWKTNKVTAFAQVDNAVDGEATGAEKEEDKTPISVTKAMELISSASSSSSSRTDIEQETVDPPEQEMDKAAFVTKWSVWPRQGRVVACARLLPMKCPLGDAFEEFVDEASAFSLPMMIRSQRNKGVLIGMVLQIRHCSARSHVTASHHWIDFVSEEERARMQRIGVVMVTLEVGNEGIIPSLDEVDAFVKVVSSFLAKNPTRVVAVYDTSSVNLTGFLICSYLVEHTNTSVDAAISAFAEARSPGIYNCTWLRELFRRYDDSTREEAYENVTDMPLHPPEWDRSKHLQRDNVSMTPQMYIPVITSSEPSTSSTIPKPSLLIPKASWVEAPHLERIQKSLQTLSKSHHPFAGMKRDMLTQTALNELGGWPGLLTEGIQLTWCTQPQGKRVLVLLLREGCFIAFPHVEKSTLHELTRRDCHIAFVPDSWLPRRKDPKARVDKTLVEGEIVVDNVEGVETTRLLITDVLSFEGHWIGKHPLSHRLHCAKVELIEPKASSGVRPLLSMRLKKMFAFSQAADIFNKVMPMIPHPCEGLIISFAKRRYPNEADCSVAPSAVVSISLRYSESDLTPGEIISRDALLTGLASR